MKTPAQKLKDLDPNLYYTLLEYKDRYQKEFTETFVPEIKVVNDLSREGLIIWIGFVIGKMHQNVKQLITEL